MPPQLGFWKEFIIIVQRIKKPYQVTFVKKDKSFEWNDSTSRVWNAIILHVKTAPNKYFFFLQIVFLSSGLYLFAWIFLEAVAGFSVWSALRTWCKKNPTKQNNQAKKTKQKKNNTRGWSKRLFYFQYFRSLNKAREGELDIQECWMSLVAGSDEITLTCEIELNKEV